MVFMRVIARFLVFVFVLTLLVLFVSHVGLKSRAVCPRLHICKVSEYIFNKIYSKIDPYFVLINPFFEKPYTSVSSVGSIRYRIYSLYVRVDQVYGLDNGGYYYDATGLNGQKLLFRVEGAKVQLSGNIVKSEVRGSVQRELLPLKKKQLVRLSWDVISDGGNLVNDDGTLDLKVVSVRPRHIMIVTIANE